MKGLNRASALGAALLGLLAIAGCQTSFQDPLSGRWAADDGVFVATFSGGAFTSRLTTTEEVVAEGSYRPTASGVDLSWLSIATNQQRSAVCTFIAANRLSCQPAGAQPFTMTKVG